MWCSCAPEASATSIGILQTIEGTYVSYTFIVFNGDEKKGIMVCSWTSLRKCLCHRYWSLYNSKFVLTCVFLGKHSPAK